MGLGWKDKITLHQHAYDLGSGPDPRPKRAESVRVTTKPKHTKQKDNDCSPLRRKFHFLLEVRSRVPARRVRECGVGSERREREGRMKERTVRRKDSEGVGESKE
ncbi:hypothetical protein LSTR_LSTR001305 [Laodelphax striatellus]|uniref:Uncharacterized protein n=1 Tax=Laodelphax striatellus TaxID=195883 RepID=A0A482XBR4_LAOST|nr:hypothetical protein LSTR_LSTR001305 [Laodelphax striatellus]